MSVRAPVGPVNFATERICIGRGLAAIRPKKNIDRDFLFYFFLNHEPALVGNAGAVFNSINKTQIESLQLPIPPLQEQERIVSILDDAFEGIATASGNAEKNLSNAREVFQGYLKTVISDGSNNWNKHTLKEMALTFGRGKSKHRPRNEPKLYGGKYPFIQTGNIRNSDHFISGYTQTYSDAGLAQSKLWPKGTLCITIAANIAETGILTFDSCFPDSVIGFVADPNKSDVHFVEYLLGSFKARLQAKGKGSAQDNLNLASFENELFPFPSIKQQKILATKLDELAEEVTSLESVYKNKIDSLTELKKSILHQAFTGQLH
jgi:type I restriction enzyme, S subunit